MPVRLHSQLLLGGGVTSLTNGLVGQVGAGTPPGAPDAAVTEWSSVPWPGPDVAHSVTYTHRAVALGFGELSVIAHAPSPTVTAANPSVAADG